MERKNHGFLHKTLKWIWLLSNCATFPLAMQYYSCFSAIDPWWAASKTATIFHAVMALICIVAAPVLWIITSSLLIMYRFPLDIPRAVMLLAGFYLQFAVLWWTGDSLAFAMFVSVYATLAAVFVWLIPMIVKARHSSSMPGALSSPGSFIAAVTVLVVVLLAPPVALFPMLFAGFARMSISETALSLAVILLNSGFTMKELVDLSIFGVPDPLEKEYAAEWEHWAAPTVILLILSMVGGAVIAAVMRR